MLKALSREIFICSHYKKNRFSLSSTFSDLEDVLTLQTKLYRCAHIFLGKCLPPVTSRRNPLLRSPQTSMFQLGRPLMCFLKKLINWISICRTAYGISPDRNLRDRQVIPLLLLQSFTLHHQQKDKRCKIIANGTGFSRCDRH